MIKEALSWDPLRPRSLSSRCITAVKCALLCVWGLGFRTLFFLKYQTDQSCICSGKAGVGGSLSTFLLDYSWKELWENTLQPKPSQEFCFVLIRFLSFSLLRRRPFYFLLHILHCYSPRKCWSLFICTSQKQRLMARLWTRCYNVPSYKPVSLCSRDSTSLCPFRNQKAEFNHLGWNIDWAKEVLHYS